MKKDVKKWDKDHLYCINYLLNCLSDDLYDYCKDPIWFLGPKGKRIQAQRAQYNEFVESRLENQALMSCVTIIMDSDYNKVKIDWSYLKKIVLGTIRGDQFLYIFLEFRYKHSSCCYSVLLLIF